MNQGCLEDFDTESWNGALQGGPFLTGYRFSLRVADLVEDPGSIDGSLAERLYADLCMGHRVLSFSGVFVIEFEVAICDLKLGSRIAAKSRQTTETWSYA